MHKVPVNKERFLEHLNEQIYFLEASCKNFDAGIFIEAKRIAVVVRNVVHDTKSSTSLLSHLDSKNILFMNTALKYYERNLLPYQGLIGFRLGGEYSGFIAHCLMPDGGPINIKWISFDDWWNGIVVKVNGVAEITRKELILSAANQDGGAHVDSKIDLKYESLARGGLLGWKVSSDDDNLGVDMPHAEAQSIRQIGFELLQTLKAIRSKILLNQKCSCGSGRKRRYCCEKNKVDVD